MRRKDGPLGTDLRLVFAPDGGVDLDLSGGGATRIDGLENLGQALAMRLLTGEGEIREIGHLSYGSRLREMIGEPLDRPNLDLLRRRVRQALLRDPRVQEVTAVTITPRPDASGVVDVLASVRAISGDLLSVEIVADLG